MKTMTELQEELFDANSAQDLDRAKHVLAEMRRHPDYRHVSRARGQRYAIATRRNSRPII